MQLPLLGFGGVGDLSLFVFFLVVGEGVPRRRSNLGSVLEENEWDGSEGEGDESEEETSWREKEGEKDVSVQLSLQVGRKNGRED